MAAPGEISVGLCQVGDDALDSGGNGEGGPAITALVESLGASRVNQISEVLGEPCNRRGLGTNDTACRSDLDERVEVPPVRIRVRGSGQCFRGNRIRDEALSLGDSLF